MRRAPAAIMLAMALALVGCSGGTSAESSAGESASQSTTGQTQSAQQAEREASEPEGESQRLGSADTGREATEKEAISMRLSIDGTEVAVQWEDSESVAALADMAADGPLTIQMSMYGGFEQVGPLGATLPSSDVQTTTQAGDVVLYSSSQIVVFYGSNSWAYTRLGRIADLTPDELEDLLGNGDVVLTITAE